MPIKQNREYRTFAGEIEFREEDDKKYFVEGYASTFEPYVLLEIDGEEFKEQIDQHAFDAADMTDVVFRVDHEGTVFARTSNNSIELFPDSHGLHVRADLSRTEAARKIYEEIKAGMYPKMSFAFAVEDGGDDYLSKEHTRMIYRIKKLYDVSPVTFPANPGTEIGVSMRDYFNGAIEAEKAERLKREKQIKALELKLKIIKGD